LKVGIFYNSISNPAKFSNKVMLMDNFKAGVLSQGDEVIEYRGNQLPDQKLDLGFVLGYTLEENFRKKIINSLRSTNTPQVYVDSNILHYARQEHEWHRYSLNSVYPHDGVYFFNNIDKSKWETVKSWHGTDMLPWRTTGNHILVLAQRPKGFNMFTDQDAWLDKTINAIKQNTDRPIVIRMHPGDSTREKQTAKIKKRFGKDFKYGRMTISTHTNIQDELVNCWCSVGYASTPNVVSAIRGVPVYVEEIDKSWAKDVAFNDMSLIDNPPMPDRSEWIHKIANIHWSNQEVISGKLWTEIKNYISSAHR
jgi:hypothetical protein